MQVRNLDNDIRGYTKPQCIPEFDLCLARISARILSPSGSSLHLPESGPSSNSSKIRFTRAHVRVQLISHRYFFEILGFMSSVLPSPDRQTGHETPPMTTPTSVRLSIERFSESNSYVHTYVQVNLHPFSQFFFKCM